MKTKNLLLIFTRNPELGKVKSRLAKDIGAIKALEIYKELLVHTRDISIDLKVDKCVYYSEKIIKNDIWDKEQYAKQIQKGKDLGERMHNAFLEGFENGYTNIVIIGSDIYDLEQKHLEEAFENLKSNTTVIGPSEDGGYYLLGMKKLFSEVFQNKEWGTPSVLESTIQNLKIKGSINFLEKLNDIDVISDIKNDSPLNKYI